MAWPEAAGHPRRMSTSRSWRGAREADAGMSVATGAGAARNAALLARLRTWRNATAHAAGVPAYRVLTNRTLEELATRSPGTRDDLLRIRGVGPATVAKYGEGILGILCPGARPTASEAPRTE